LSRKALLAITVAGLILLNGLTFIMAYPETLVVDGGCCSSQPLAKDFSAYYVGAWRMLNDPAQLYTKGFVNDGGPVTPPAPESYKYMPSFLLLVSPLLLGGYQEALLVFDLIQFLLLPLIALLLYWLLKGESAVVVGFVMLLVLLQPSPLPHWGLSVSYYWQWAEGQAKVLETFLLVLSFFLARSGRPKLSGAVFALAAFDPRFAALGIPLFLLFNRRRVAASSLAACASLVVLNVPLLYPPVGAGFVGMILSSGISTPLYYYSLIPMAALLSLYAVNWRELVSMVSSRFRAKPEVPIAPHGASPSGSSSLGSPDLP
jgi:hypothetical protein